MAFAALFQGTAAPEHVETLRESLTTLARKGRNEPGTIRYEFYNHEDEPAVFLLFAVWESEADWQAHVAGDAHTQHIASRPEDAWTIPPTMTRLRALADVD